VASTVVQIRFVPVDQVCSRMVAWSALMKWK
jgi:hypothetical protein